MVKIGAILIFTRQFEEMSTFYRDVVGLPVKELDPGEGYRVSVDWIAFDTGEAVLEVFDEYVHGGQLENLEWIQGHVIPALGTNDIEAWITRAGDSIERLGPVREAAWGTFVYIRDADGNVLQVYEERPA